MKLFVSIIALIILFSCDETNEPSQDNQLLGNWELVKISGSMIANSPPITGDDLEAIETLKLSTDGTFLKTATQKSDGSVSKAKGSYSINEQLKLVHDSRTILLRNCTGDEIEYMKFHNDSLVASDAIACDGAIYSYIKK